MAKSTSSNYKTKKEAQNALDRFKMEVASEIGVNLKDGYNGDLTSAYMKTPAMSLGKR